MKQQLKKQLLILSFFILNTSVFSQTNFEKGVYITNSGEKVECLIKNIDWKNNPVDFKYRLANNSDTETQNIDDVKEFEVYGNYKYIRATVDIDRSSSNLDDLTEDRNPVFKKETLFLRVLVEGEAILYRYEDRNLVRFFYKVKDRNIEQLVFKEYRRQGGVIGENNYYKQQLYNNLKCNSITMSDVEKLDYKIKYLPSFFEAYNNCNSDNKTVSYKKKNKRDLFNLRAKIGLGQGSLSIDDPSGNALDVDFDSETIFRVGAELEMILPFNNDKWALIVEPSYQSYTSQSTVFNSETFGIDSRNTVDATYTTVEIPLGFRHYFFINDDSKIFVNAFYSLIFTNNSKIEPETGLTLDIEKASSQSLGLGYSHKKFSLEFRYELPREIFSNYINWSSDYNQISLIFGYQFF